MEEGDIFLDEYTGQSIDDLISLQTTHRIDSLVSALESALDSKKDSGKDMSEVEMTILAVEALDREVNNGGFSQFFYNSSVEYTPIIVDSLKAIGCNEIAELTKKAIDLLGLDALDPDVIEERMDPDDEELEEALGELDDIYYSEINDAPAYALFEFIKSHRDKITLA